MKQIQPDAKRLERGLDSIRGIRRVRIILCELAIS